MWQIFYPARLSYETESNNNSRLYGHHDNTRKLYSKCLEDYTALFLEPRSSSTLFLSRTELCRSEFCCTDLNPTPLYSGIFFYLQSCTKYITITQIITDTPWGQRLFCATLMVASPPAHHRFFTRMNNSWHGALTSTFPAPGWDGFFPTCFPDEKTKA